MTNPIHKLYGILRFKQRGQPTTISAALATKGIRAEGHKCDVEDHESPLKTLRDETAHQLCGWEHFVQTSDVLFY